MLPSDLRFDPMRLKQAQPDQFDTLMRILHDDAPGYEQMIEEVQSAEPGSLLYGTKMYIRCGNIPQAAQDIVEQAMNKAKQRDTQ